MQTEPKAKRPKLIPSRDYYNLTGTNSITTAAAAPVNPTVSTNDPAREDKAIESEGDTEMGGAGEIDALYDGLLKKLESRS